MSVSLPVTANAVECVDCDDVYLGEVECPEDVDHATSPAYVTDTPLGVEPQREGQERPDEDYWHWGRNRYEYSGDDKIVREGWR